MGKGAGRPRCQAEAHANDIIPAFFALFRDQQLVPRTNIARAAQATKLLRDCFHVRRAPTDRTGRPRSVELAHEIFSSGPAVCVAGIAVVAVLCARGPALLGYIFSVAAVWRDKAKAGRHALRNAEETSSELYCITYHWHGAQRARQFRVGWLAKPQCLLPGAFRTRVPLLFLCRRRQRLQVH